jgi:hypothetical protein
MNDMENRSTTDEASAPLPAPTFEMFVQSLAFQAEVQLGLIQLPGQEPVERNLPAAKYTLDLLAILKDKTRGNLSLEEERLLNNAFTELVFRYQQAQSEGATS